MCRVGGLAILSLLLARVAAGQQSEATSDASGFEAVGEAGWALLVEDVEAAARWYAEAFALEEASRRNTGDGRVEIRNLRGPGITLELIQLRGAARPADRSLGIFKVGLAVDDLERAHRWFRARSDATDSEISYDPDLELRFFVTRDPFGNRLQLFERCENPCDPG